MPQWIKNPTAAVRVAAEAQVQSLAQELPFAMGPAKKNEKRNLFLSMSLDLLLPSLLAYTLSKF